MRAFPVFSARLAAVALTGLGLALGSLAARGQALQQGMWVTDGTVNAVALSDTVEYIGGTFSRVGPPIGGAALIDPTSGAVLQPWPQVVGTVNAVLSDGGGGWYIGGQFTHVQGQPRVSLAHLDGSGNLTSWAPTPAGGTQPIPIVLALARNGSTVYIGGNFTSMNSVTRNDAAAVDAGTGAFAAWDPEADGNVDALAILGGTVYAGGLFAHIGGQPRSGIAALDATSGVATGWNPGLTGRGVYTLALTQRIAAPFTITVWAGGGFTFIGGQTRNNIAAIDGGTGSAMSWDPNSNGEVYALALRVNFVTGNATTIYAAGAFTHIGGQVRDDIAALDATGAATSWDPHADNAVRSLALGGSVYAGGDFAHIGGQNRNDLAALDPTTSAATSWDPDPDHSVSALGWDGSRVLAGGQFNSLGGVARSDIAALRRSDGTATAWNPNANGTLTALTLHGGAVYAGGFFSSVGSVPHANLAAIDVVSGAPTGWTPSTDGTVEALAIHGDTVYVGGSFANVNGQPRTNLGAINALTGAATSWDPGTIGACQGCIADVRALAVSALPSPPYTITVWAGGAFQFIGYVPNTVFRAFLAAIDGTTGVPTTWDPSADGFVQTLALRFGSPPGTVSDIYAGGSFSFLGAGERHHIGEIDPAGAVTGWAPDADGEVDAIALSGSAVYAGGKFANIGGQPRVGLAQLDPATGAATAWNAGLEPMPINLLEVPALAVGNGLLYAGGEFIGALGLPHASLAAVSEGLAPAAVEPPPAAAPIALSAAPNPFRDRVSLRFSLPASQPAEVTVYDLSGRRIRTLQRGLLDQGAHDLQWDGRTDAGRAVDAGVYFARVRAATLDVTRRVLRIR